RNDQTGQRRRGGEEESESYAGCGTTSGGCRKVFTDSGRAPRRLDTQIVSTMGLPCRQELLCERFDQIDLIDLAVEPDTVDEEGGRAVLATGDSTPEVVADPRDMGPRRKFARHLLERQPEMLREVGEQRIPQSLLVLQQQVVHFPEPVPGAGEFGHLGCPQRLRVQGRQREIAEHETQFRAKARPDSRYDPVGCTAAGALVITVLDERYRRIVGPEAVVGRRHIDLELSHGYLPAMLSRASRIPSAPGLTSIGDTCFHAMRPPGSMTKRARSEVPSPGR